MNDTVKQIVGILEEGRPELQVAAAQILGELRSKDAAVVKALAAAATRTSVLGRYAIEALAHIGSVEALQVVVGQVCENEMLADQAMHLLGEAGAVAHGVIAKAFTETPANKRLRLLQVLLREPGKDTVAPVVLALSDADTAAAAAELVEEHADDVPDKVQKSLREALVKALGTELAEASTTAMLTVLARLNRSAAKPTLLKHAGDRFASGIRVAALHALAGEQLTGLQVKSLLAWLEDPAHAVVHGAVRDVLGALPEWPTGNGAAGLGPALKRMLASRNHEQRLFALRAMRHTASPELVKMALKLRDHDDPRFQRAAEDVLSSSKHAIEPLLRLLQLSKDPIEGARLARLLTALGPQMPLKQVKAIAERAVKGLAVKSPTADLLCDIAIEVGGAKIVPFFLDKAIRWRRSKKFPEALHLLAKLATNSLLDDEGLYQLALARFLQDVHRPAGDGAAPGNAAMGFFTSLLRGGFKLLERVKKDASVPPELQLRLATYFADTVGPERRFGTELLQLLAQRHKGRTGDEARTALRSVGLG